MPTVQGLKKRNKDFITSFLSVKMALTENQILEMSIFNTGDVSRFYWLKGFHLTHGRS